MPWAFAVCAGFLVAAVAVYARTLRLPPVAGPLPDPVADDIRP